MRSLTGRRAFWYARISAAAHALEPVVFGVLLASGIHLTARQAGALLLRDRRGVPSSELVTPGLLLLAGVTLVVASLLFFHHKGRTLRQRLLAAAVATSFFALGYRAELGAVRTGAFHGMTTLSPGARLIEDVPGRPKVEYRLSASGLRGPDFAERKAAGVFRVAVAGDSFVYGTGVEEADTLPVKLAARLRDRFPAVIPEVLNLGVPGNHLASHLAMLRVAERHLGADVLVLCLTLPDDLSPWDGEAERAERRSIGGFSFASYLLGHPAASTLWGRRHVARSIDEEGLTFLHAEIARLREDRTPASKPLIVFTTAVDETRINAALRSIPSAVLVPPVRFDPAHYIPGDGHPTAAGNDAFAERIASAFEPGWSAAR